MCTHNLPVWFDNGSNTTAVVSIFSRCLPDHTEVRIEYHRKSHHYANCLQQHYLGLINVL